MNTIKAAQPSNVSPKKPKEQDCDLITQSTIRERGWTDGMISKFLGPPDQTKTNPYYKSGPAMRLYSLKRIEAVEATDEVKIAMSKTLAQRGNRVAGAQKATKTKTDSLLLWVESLAVHVPKMAIGTLIKQACEHYDHHHNSGHRGYYEFSGKSASSTDSPEFLERIIGNYIRHELTDYESQLTGIAGKVGTGEAYDALKHKIMSKIEQVYPDMRGQIADWQSAQ